MFLGESNPGTKQHPEDKFGAGAPKADRFCKHNLAAILQQNWLQIKAVLLLLWISLLLWSVDGMLHEQQLAVHTNSAQVQDLLSTMATKFHLCR